MDKFQRVNKNCHEKFLKKSVYFETIDSTIYGQNYNTSGVGNYVVILPEELYVCM